MGKFRLATAIVVLLACCALWAQDDPAPASLDLPDGEGSFVFAAPPPAGWEKVAETVSARFQASWLAYFGSRPEAPSGAVVAPATDLRHGLFEALWSSASAALPAADAPAAHAALSRSVLGDESATLDALARFARGGKLDARTIDGPLLYAFLRDSVASPAFLPQALPPGEKEARLRLALDAQGVSWDVFLNRFAGWLFTAALERRLLPSAPATLPAVWLLDGDLKPGEFAVWRLPLADPTSGVDLDIAGGAPPGLRLVSLYTGATGRVAQCGVCDLASTPSVLPRQGTDLWLILWNASSQETGAGLTLTLWKDYQPPFVVRSAALRDRTVELTLEERDGIADYRLLGRLKAGAPFRPLQADPFASEGPGTHHYRVLVREPFAPYADLKIACRTLSGGQFGTALKPGETAP